MFKSVVKFFLVFLITGSFAYADMYTVDKGHSGVTFKVRHLAISNVDGKFSGFNGKFNYDHKSKVFKSLEGEVDINTIDTGIEKRDNHLKSEDFFLAEKYPKMIFKMTKYEADGDEGVMYGDLTIRGTTKPVKWDVEINGYLPKDRDGNPRVGLTMKGKVNRHDYGLKWNSIVEGFPAVGDDVKMTVELQGVAN